MVIVMNRPVLVVELAVRVMSVTMLAILPVVIMSWQFCVMIGMGIPMIIAMIITSMAVIICVRMAEV